MTTGGAVRMVVVVEVKVLGVDKTP